MKASLTRALVRRTRVSRVATPALVAVTVMALGTASASAVARPGQPGHGPGLAGTTGATGAKTSSGEHARFLHLGKSASQSASGDLSTVLTATGRGGYTAAGIGMRNLGYGTISITGVPAGATVKSAILMWDILADQSDPTFAQGTFAGTAITGTAWASGASPCWPVGGNFSYEADVTDLVTGNGDYDLAGFATGEADGADPWNVGSTPPLLEGASLVVIYQDNSMPDSFFQVAEGATETEEGNSAEATLTGFTASSTPTATTTYIVADGQEAGNTATFNGTDLPVGFPGGDPQAVPNYSMGNLWDTVTTDVSSLVNPGDTSATVDVTGGGDCLVWVGQVLDVTGGAVLGLGDSVAAGYGLGASEGFPDNPAAYPSVLAGQLGVPVKNLSIEGACAGSPEFACVNEKTVASQLQHLPQGYTPSIVTLTIGADDIDFSECVKMILLGDDLAVQNPKDPCEKNNLDAALTDFQNNLTADLSKISSTFPNASILVMDYYNPFPSASEDTCSLAKGVALLDYYKKFKEEHPGDSAWENWKFALSLFFNKRHEFEQTAKSDQAQIYSDAQSIIGQLNGAIEAATSEVDNTTIINVDDFTGHDMCVLHPQWIFSPAIHIAFSVKLPLLGTRHHEFQLGENDICPHPINEGKYGKTIDVVHSDIVKVSFVVTLNCMPHPTTTGQKKLANDFFQQVGFSVTPA